jgi:hypothetical protein
LPRYIVQLRECGRISGCTSASADTI